RGRDQSPVLGCHGHRPGGAVDFAYPGTRYVLLDTQQVECSLVDGELRRAAFGDQPAPPSALLTAAESGRARLLASIVLGTQGRYAAAATPLGELVKDRDQVIAALALATLAAHRRQLGGHALALKLDARALRLGSAVSGESDP